MKYFNCLLLFLLISTSLEAQEINTLDYRLLRQDDVINIDSSLNFYYKIKEIKLGNETSLSFGGSHRFQIEGFVNEEFDKDLDQSDYWFLNRSMFHAHLKTSDRLAFFLEFNSSQIASKENLAPVDKDQLGINQMFVDLNLSDHWSARIGRQNLRLGSGRLIDVREGPNIRLSFDMADLRYVKDNTQVSTFFGGPFRPDSGIFDNRIASEQEYLTGVYWTQNWTEKFNTDIYFIFKSEANKVWNNGMEDDNRASIGLRYFGDFHGLAYNNEIVVQIGKFGEQDIRAWTLSFDVKKPLVLQNGQVFHLGVRTELISGDRSTDDASLNTFDGLYPRGAYFGRVARFGPSNMFDIHPYLEFELGEVSFEFDYVAFWRLSVQDGLYGPPLNLAYLDLNDERFIGHQIGGIIGFSPQRQLSFEIESNIIFPKGFLSQSSLDDNLLHVVFTSEYKF